MADNTTLDPGSGGDTFATDDIGSGVKVPRSKIMLGADGANDGDVSSTNPMPVALAAGAASIGKAEDVASANADVGVPAMMVRKASPANTSGTDGDYEMLQGLNGRLYVSATVDAALPAGTNAIGKLAANSGVVIGDVNVAAITAGSNLIGDVGLQPRTSGGLTIFRSLSVINSTLQIVKASAGQLYWLHCMNMSAGVRYLKFYNAVSGTIGTGTPALTFPIPTMADTNGAGFTFAIPQGLAFGTGICVGASTDIADNDTGAPGTNEVVLNMGYK